MVFQHKTTDKRLNKTVNPKFEDSEIKADETKMIRKMAFSKKN